MRSSILIPGCKSLSSTQDCLKTYHTTHLQGWIAFMAKILKIAVRPVLNYFWKRQNSTFSYFVKNMLYIHVYVICQLGNPYSEKLLLRSWKCCPRLRPEVTVFTKRTDPKPVNNIFPSSQMKKNSQKKLMQGLENPDRVKNQSVSRICYRVRLEKNRDCYFAFHKCLMRACF